MWVYCAVFFDGNSTFAVAYEDRDKCTEFVRRCLAEMEEEGIPNGYRDLVAEVGYGDEGDEGPQDRWKGSPTFVEGDDNIQHLMFYRTKLKLG